MVDSKEAQEPEELVLIAGANPETRDVTVVRPTSGGVETAVLQPVQEGKPLMGDLVRLEPLPRLPILARMRTVLRHPDRRPSPGPTDDIAPVSRTFLGSTEAYRRGWAVVFGTGNQDPFRQNDEEPQ